MDQGSSVNIVRADVWEALKILLDCNMAVTLKTTDTGQGSTVGQILRLQLTISILYVDIIVQVV